MGKNWNSRTGKFEEIKSKEIQDMADRAKELRLKGFTVAEISKNLV